MLEGIFVSRIRSVVAGTFLRMQHVPRWRLGYRLFRKLYATLQHWRYISSFGHENCPWQDYTRAIDVGKNSQTLKVQSMR